MSSAAEDAALETLAIRPPQQRRSREAWRRVLDAGVTLLEEGGYEAFTIAAVCARAQVAPRAIYARADSKDALFLAVYEHGIARVAADQAAFADEQLWRDLPTEQLITAAVRQVETVFTRNARFLRAVVLISGVHPEIQRRGALYAQALGDSFAAVLLLVAEDIGRPDPEAAVRAAFNAVFSSLVLRVAYGPAFATPAVDDETFIQTLTAMVRAYLYPR